MKQNDGKSSEHSKINQRSKAIKKERVQEAESMLAQHVKYFKSGTNAEYLYEDI